MKQAMPDGQVRTARLSSFHQGARALEKAFADPAEHPVVFRREELLREVYAYKKN
jgi:hypothetical protein